MPTDTGFFAVGVHCELKRIDCATCGQDVPWAGNQYVRVSYSHICEEPRLRFYFRQDYPAPPITYDEVPPFRFDAI